MVDVIHSTLIDADLHNPGYVQAGDPGAVGAGRLWIDTSGGAGAWVAKIRNTANNGWETVGTSAISLSQLSDVSSAAQTANFVLAAGDGAAGGDYRGRLLVPADIPNLDAAKITSGLLALARGGAAVDLSGTGPGFLRQAGAGAVVSVAPLAEGDIPSLSAYIPKSLVDAKGDLLVATADDTPTRLPVGADGKYLKANSAVAAGVEWADPGGVTDHGALTGLSDDDHPLYFVTAGRSTTPQIITPQGAPLAGTEPSIVSLWHFNEGAGVVADDAVGANDLTLNAATWTALSKFGAFAMGTTYASRANPLGAGAWTVMGWIYSTNYNGANDGVFSVANSPVDGGPRVLLRCMSRELHLYVGGSDNTAQNTSLQDNTWYHVTVSFDGTSRYRVYLNGRLVLSVIATPAGNQTNFYIGTGFNAVLAGGRYDEWAYFSAELDSVYVVAYAGQQALLGGITARDFIQIGSHYVVTSLGTFWYSAAGRIMVSLNPSSDTSAALFYGQTDGVGFGPVHIIYRGTSGYAGLVLDASPGGGGRWNVMSATSGALHIYGVAGFVLNCLSNGHVGFNTVTDLGQVGILTSGAAVKSLAIRGAASQTAPVNTHEDSAGSIHNQFHIPHATNVYETVFNEQGSPNLDWRVESDNYDALKVDASNDAAHIMSNAAGKIGFFGATPVAQPTELTDELTTITHTAPGTPDYAIQALTAGGFGFVTQDEGHSVLAVIANLQARVNELETKLTSLGLLVDAD